MTAIRFGRVLGCVCLFAVLAGNVSAAPVSRSSASSAAATGTMDRAMLAKAGVRINEEAGVAVMNDFALGPGRTAISLSPGEQQTVEVQVSSRTPGLHSYLFQEEDFSADPRGGDSTTLYGVEKGPFPASTWVHPAVPSLQLTHGEQAYVPVTISVPKNAEPGDHYAALLLKRALTPAEESTKGFSIISRVGILFLITVKGPVTQNASLTSLRSRAPIYWFYPAFLELTARNDGTVYATPTGVIQIHNILGFVVDEIPVNDWFILRNSSRTIVFDWRPRFALGRYTAVAKIQMYGTDTVALQTSFWVIPALPVLIVLFAIFLVSFLVQFFFSRFEIKKKG